MLRKTVASQLGHPKISMTQDGYLGHRLTDRQTAEVLEALFDRPDAERVPKMSRILTVDPQ